MLLYLCVTSSNFQFHPPTFEYGKAPYPQQPPFNPTPVPGEPTGPMAPAAPSAPVSADMPIKPR